MVIYQLKSIDRSWKSNSEMKKKVLIQNDHSEQQILEFKQQMERSHEEQLKRITEMVSLVFILFHLFVTCFCVCILLSVDFYIYSFSFIRIYICSMQGNNICH
jgi:hypothetical protein